MIAARWRPRWLVALLALVLGLGVRLWFIRHHVAVDGDSLLYGDIAKNLLGSHVYGFTQEGGAPLPTLIRLPGYPFFLAMCFRLFGVEHYNAVLYVQCAVDLGACWLLGSAAGRLFRSRGAGSAALVLAALCPLTANYVAAPLTETLTLATISVTFYGLVRWIEAGAGWDWWLAVISGAMGASLLLRPEQALLAGAVLPVMVWVLWRREGGGPGGKWRRASRAVAPALVCGLGVAIMLLPWVVRNALTFHVFEPLAPRSATDPGERVPRGFNRWFRTWGVDFGSTEDVYWNYDGNTIDPADLPERVADTPEQLEATRQLISDYNSAAKATSEIESRFAELAEVRIRASPMRFYALLPIARLANMLLRPRTELLAVPLDWWRYREHPRWTLIAWGLGAVNLFYFAAGISGGVRGWGAKPGGDSGRAVLFAAMLFVLLRCALLLTLDNSEPRYTLEFFPLAILCASVLFKNSSTHTHRWHAVRRPRS